MRMSPGYPLSSSGARAGALDTLPVLQEQEQEPWITLPVLQEQEQEAWIPS